MSRALSSRTIVIWSVGLVVAAAVAVALLLAARRQRYVELDLEQKEHDANERRVTELYGKAADQLGSDKAPVRLAGLYALERLAQDDPRQRQPVVNLLCAYLRMPYRAPKDPADDAAMQERLVRGAVQEVLESHLQPAVPGRFWPDINLRLTSADLEFFWFRGCEVHEADFSHVTFHEIAAFRDSRFTGRAYFQRARFTGTADLRRAVFSSGRFRDTRFEGDVDFGDEPVQARQVDLDGATATTAAERHWPAGWTDEPDPDVPDQVRVVRESE